MLLRAWPSRCTPYSLYKPGRTADAPSYQGPRWELDYRADLTRPELVTKAAERFMLETGLLSQFQTLPTTYRVTETDRKQPAAQRSQGYALAEVGTETRQ